MTMPDFNDVPVAARDLALKVLGQITSVRLHLRSDPEFEVLLHPRDSYHVQKMCHPNEPRLWGQKVFESEYVSEGEPLVIPVGSRS